MAGAAWCGIKAVKDHAVGACGAGLSRHCCAVDQGNIVSALIPARITTQRNSLCHNVFWEATKEAVNVPFEVMLPFQNPTLTHNVA